MTKFYFLKNKGFTLIEILIVISIIVILSIFVFVNYRTGQRELALERATNKLVQDLRYIQKMALELTVVPGTDIAPSGGYGIYIDIQSPTQYILFADCDKNREYTTNENVCGGQRPELIETVQLEREVEISEICFNSKCDNIERPYIIYLPPDPITFIRGGDEARITLRLRENPNRTKTIFVGFLGVIYIE